MKFTFLWIGKTRDPNLKALQEEYLKRLSHFAKCDVMEARESAKHDSPEIEGKRILQLLNPKSFVCLLDIAGKPMASEELAATIEKWQLRAVRDVTFVIGGADGVAAEIGEMADFRLSLSFMTFTHEMARVILLEQLYRGFSIINGFPYQK